MEELGALKVTAARFGKDSYVIALVGELDLHTASRFQRQLDMEAVEGFAGLRAGATP